MRPRNVLTETNDMRKLMGLPLLNEDTGDSIKDIKKKVLNEDRSFSLGFGNQGGLTIDETDEAEEFNKENDGAPINDVREEEYDVEYQDDNWLVLHDDEDDEPLRTPMEDNLTEQDRFYTPSDEEVEYWKEKETPDEENAFTDWVIKNRVRLFSERGIENYKQVTDADDWKYFLQEWLNSSDYRSADYELNETGIDVDGASDIGGGLDPLDQVVAEQHMRGVLNKIKKFITPPGPGRREHHELQKEYKKFKKEFAKDPREAVIAKLKQYSPGKEKEINELINDPEMIDNLIKWVNSGTSSWTGPNINESTEDWGFSQYNITLHD